jgi:hypothetical protein
MSRKILGLLLFLTIFSNAGHAVKKETIKKDAVKKVIYCENAVEEPYNNSPEYFAPDGSRGLGISIWKDGKLSSIPDTTPRCLPIALRYNNLGAVKTQSKGPWPNQIAKDSKGHAVFRTVEDGITAWGFWMKNKSTSKKLPTAMSIMSVYAPPTDCVGSKGQPPKCPYGINPTKEYASRVASSVGKQPDDALNLDGTDCKEGREALYKIFLEISTFEIGGDFCGKENRKSLPLCVTDRNVFDTAMDSAYGKVDYRKCAVPAKERKKGLR